MLDKRYLTECEQEQLHLTGAIQPHGALLVLGPDDRIVNVSSNIDHFLPEPGHAWLGQPLPASLEGIRPLLQGLGSAEGLRRTVRAGIEGKEGLLDCVIRRNANAGTLVELTPAQDFTAPRNHRAHEPYRDDISYRSARQALVGDLMKLTGFQRVMYYQFLENDDGLVVAEARNPQAYGSFMDHRFPASDIPRIARQLYVKQPWRLIPDATREPVPVIGQTETVPDLTWSDLRSVSPVHRVYLANMGVRASLSFPVILNGHLSALIACHHTAPSYPSLSTLEIAAQQVQAHALAVSGFHSQQRMRLLDSLDARFLPARHMLQRHGSLLSAWAELGPWLIQTFDADGALLCLGDYRLDHGLSLEPTVQGSLEAWLQIQDNDPLLPLDSLSRTLPGFPPSQCAGALVVRGKSALGEPVCLVLTRREQIEEVLWGGNPEKPVEHHDGTLGIAPRHSFEKWVEKRLGYCRPWNNESRVLAFKLREILGMGPLK
ncbi:MAG: GAF domain-containing protein [Pseudomonadota bacterium]